MAPANAGIYYWELVGMANPENLVLLFNCLLRRYIYEIVFQELHTYLPILLEKFTPEPGLNFEPADPQPGALPFKLF